MLAYIRFRRDILQGELPEFTCLVGTMAQETHQTSRAIAEACHASMSGHAATLEPDIAAAMRERGLGPEGAEAAGPRGARQHTQAELQGAFILAKAEGGPARRTRQRRPSRPLRAAAVRAVGRARAMTGRRDEPS